MLEELAEVNDGGGRDIMEEAVDILHLLLGKATNDGPVTGQLI